MQSTVHTENWLKKVREASERISPYIHKTPLHRCRTLSEKLNSSVYFKMENLQKTGSFKIRGAVNKIFSLSQQAAQKGIVSASAGNHAQGVAWAANARQVPAVIVMPVGAPLAKIRATEAYGAKVVLHGQTYDESYQYALQLKEENQFTFIHAFDDEEIIAGQGTVAFEILSRLFDMEAVIVPVGGGGLLAGVAAALKEHNPRIQVYGVQAEGAPAMAQSFANKKRECLTYADTIADGIRVKEPGKLTFDLIQHYADNVVTVSDDDISEAILFLLERGKMTTEGAGAAGVASLLSGKIKLNTSNVAVVVSGGNIDPLLLSKLIAGKYHQAANF